MHRVTPDRPWPLHDVAAIRRLEQNAAAALPPHTLMQRAGLSVARLALAIAPHARTVWIACGPGNNGGDGFEAARHLKQWGKSPVVTWFGDEARMPDDARASLQRARGAGVAFAASPPQECDLAVDALLGIGAKRASEGPMLETIDALNAAAAPVLAVDIPTGLDADTGAAMDAVRATHTLSLLALKPGLFTAAGRDCAGTVWFDDLGVARAGEAAAAALIAAPAEAARLHASHKGSYGDVAVIGGAPGMVGAAWLAASAALHHGAGRVFVGMLDDAAPTVAAWQPDLMLRRWDALDLRAMAVACGCGGGEAVRQVLPQVIGTSRALVLDADALNAVAADTQLQVLLETRGRRGMPTVLTPHPLEAARLLGVDTAAVQADRIAASRRLAQSFGCTVVLKGSGTIVASGTATRINATGNARLAIAGTGDVLAGMVAARLARGETGIEAASAAVYLHGLAADRWPPSTPLTASGLASA